MSTVVWPLDGVYGKNFRTTSGFGWRTHPISKDRKHHNGEDLIGQKYVHAIARGTVIKAQASGLKKSNGEPGGFGYYVIIRHLIDGVYYTSLYAHLKKGSFQVKKGSKVWPGTVLGQMGTSGNSTGIHLHLEIRKGKTHGWGANGAGYYDPIAFIKLHTAKDEVEKVAKLPTPDSAKAIFVPSTKPKYSQPLSIGDSDTGQDVAHMQKFLGVPVTGVFGEATHDATVKFQKKQKGIIADGVVGPITWGLMDIPAAKKKPAPKSKPAPKPKPKPAPRVKRVALSGWLRLGSTGEDVEYLQQQLKVKVDGVFGPETDKKVKAFQRSQKMKVDGIVGSVTWSKL